MKTYLDMDEILRHCRRYIGQEYDEPYLVSAVPEEVIRSLPPADVVEVRHGSWIDTEPNLPDWSPRKMGCLTIVLSANILLEKINITPIAGVRGAEQKWMEADGT